MRASTSSLVSLGQFARVLGLDPLHFAGGYSTLRPMTTCHDVWYQYQWQSAGKASREQVARALNDAETAMADLIGYWPAWKWITDERHKLKREGRWPNTAALRITANWGYMLGGGIQATSAIDAGEVTRGADLDADGDGFAELAVFTISNVDADWELEEIRACYKVFTALDAANCRTNPASSGFDEAWEIRPLNMSRSGTTVTAYVPVWDLFRPQLFEELGAEAINADAAASYVDTLSFYRVYNDPSIQASFLWGTDCLYDVTCAWAAQAGCIRTVIPRAGVITTVPGTWDADNESYTATCWTYNTTPNVVRLWYRAGLARPAPGMVDPVWADLIIKLACARLDWPICSCSNVKTLVDEYKRSVAKRTKDQAYIVTPEMLSNPFGTRVGEIMVWQALKLPARRVGRAVRT